MSALEQFREAVLRGEFTAAQDLLMQFGNEPPGEIRDALVWALQLTRIQRSHDAAQLGQLARATAYRPRNVESRSSWAIDA